MPLYLSPVSLHISEDKSYSVPTHYRYYFCMLLSSWQSGDGTFSGKGPIMIEFRNNIHLKNDNTRLKALEPDGMFGKKRHLRVPLSRQIQ